MSKQFPVNSEFINNEWVCMTCRSRSILCSCAWAGVRLINDKLHAYDVSLGNLQNMISKLTDRFIVIDWQLPINFKDITDRINKVENICGELEQELLDQQNLDEQFSEQIQNNYEDQIKIRDEEIRILRKERDDKERHCREYRTIINVQEKRIAELSTNTIHHPLA